MIRITANQRTHASQATPYKTNETLNKMQEEVLKELIKEMGLRVASFEYSRDLFTVSGAQHSYWDGKRSEAQFMVEKLTWILDNGGL